jgi:sec-independent protein translocase protein TatB
VNLSFGEILMLAVVALVVFGPERLPEVARNAGKMVARFRREANNTLDEFRRSADLQELRELREELGDVTADLKQYSPMTGPMAVRGFERTSSTDSSVRPDPHESRAPRVGGPPPFDPDAT